MKINYPSIVIIDDENTNQVIVRKDELLTTSKTELVLENRNFGELAHLGYHLPSAFRDWMIIRDDLDELVLVGIKKEK